MTRRTSDLVEVLTKFDDRPAVTLATVARHSRALGNISADTPGRGVGSAKVSDAVTLFIAANVSDTPMAGARLVPRYRALVPTIGWVGAHKDTSIGREYEEVSPKLAELSIGSRLMLAPTFGAALEVLIEDAPAWELLNRFDAQYPVEGLWSDTVTFRRRLSGVTAELRIGRGASCVYAFDICNVPKPLPRVARKVEVTIGLEVLVALNGALA